jgi:histidinol-phosphate/aromatic aminotransferase/cobyric acid decarboxylase-like protein
MTNFYRIKRLPPYVFEQVNRIKAAARANGADIIDLGMGNPDLQAPQHVIDKLVETVGKPRTDRYSASKGISGLRRAQAGYYERRFGVKLNPDTQVVATLGSKEGFANMAQAITEPGDVILVPNPSYPIHAFGFLMAGGVIRSVPAEPTPEFFIAAERAVAHSIPKPVALVVCYPSNPTAYVASLDFYRDLVAFAKKHELILLSDLAYSEVYFDEANPPPSILQVPGAIDVAVEFTSMSKTFSMAGWRIGFAVGNERLLAALARVKSYLDWRLHACPGGGHRRAERAGRLHPRDACHVQAPPGRDGRFLREGRLDRAGAHCLHVRLGADPRKVPGYGQPGILQAPGGEGRCGGCARHRLRRARRRLRTHCPRGKRAAHPPGRAQHPQVLRSSRPDAPQRGADLSRKPDYF